MILNHLRSKYYSQWIYSTSMDIDSWESSASSLTVASPGLFRMGEPMKLSLDDSSSLIIIGALLFRRGRVIEMNSLSILLLSCSIIDRCLTGVKTGGGWEVEIATVGSSVFFMNLAWYFMARSSLTQPPPIENKRLLIIFQHTLRET